MPKREHVITALGHVTSRLPTESTQGNASPRPPPRPCPVPVPHVDVIFRSPAQCLAAKIHRGLVLGTFRVKLVMSHAFHVFEATVTFAGGVVQMDGVTVRRPVKCQGGAGRGFVRQPCYSQLNI